MKAWVAKDDTGSLEKMLFETPSSQDRDPSQSPKDGRVPLGSYRERVPQTSTVAALENVRYSFDGGQSWALKDLNLSIKARERLCLMGANGSGKSTVALLLAGLRAPDEGRVELLGMPCFRHARAIPEAYRAARRRLGIVFQDPNDQIVASVVEDDVAFGPENLGLAPEAITLRVKRELDRVHALELSCANPRRLSGGQTQRVAIASALAMEPALMIFDEATAFLDVRGARALARVAGRLESLCAQVWVSHHVDDAQGATRLVVLDRGRVAFDGAPEKLLSDGERLRSFGLEPPLWLRVAEALTNRGVDLEKPTSKEAFVEAVATNLIRSRAQEKATRKDKDRGESGSATPSSEKTHGETTRVGEKSAKKATTHAPFQSGGRAFLPFSANVRLKTRAVTASSSSRAMTWEARNLGFSYEKSAKSLVLSGVDLEVPKGETLALIGATGSGKSTLARLLAGLAKPSTGALRILGEDATTKRGRRALSGRVGFVMQRSERQLFAKTVADDVAFGPRNIGYSDLEVKDRVGSALAALAIEPLATRSPFELSGGQQRLVALAGVFALEPDAWILDEPLAGLDATGRDRVQNLLDELSRQGRSLLVITHSMDQAANADRVLVMDQGAIAEIGPPSLVLRKKERLFALGLGLPEPLELANAIERAGDLAPFQLGAPLTQDELVRILELQLSRASRSEAR